VFSGRKEEKMGTGARMGILFPVMLILTGGCATREWVQETLGTKEAQIDQRFVALEGKVGEEGRRLEGMGSQVKALETSVGEAGEVAKVARERAETAVSKSDEVNSRLTRLWATRFARTPAESVEVLFGFDRWDLSDAAQTSLVTLVNELKGNDRLAVELLGYTDPTGAREYNIQLSQRRVEAVRRFLAENGVELWRIHSVGLGPILDAEIPKQKKRRVTLKLTTWD
jgi:outer membrane protein OmpA-like peptidoglycan-associated protein